MADFEITIGLEVHVQMATASKMFCGCGTRTGLPPNTQVCPICLGMPGVLPVVNKKAVELGLKIATALGCRIAPHMQFARKNYFYPDLPKGYQISQFHLPLARDGFLRIEVPQGEKTIRVSDVHLEEDAGKMMHDADEGDRSSIDFNRAGVPLVEIVSAPDMATPDEAYHYLKELKTILEYLEISDCNMEEGNLRCDANISVAPPGSPVKGTKTEVKNLNSLNFLKRAIEYQAQHQWERVQKGEKIAQATFTWSEADNRTVEIRSKEYAHDYRYFPEPDLGAFAISADWMQTVQQSLPELPQARGKRLGEEYSLSKEDARFLVQSRDEADYFETCAHLLDDAQEIINWLKGKIHGFLNDQNLTIRQFPIPAQELVALLRLIKENKVSRSAAKDIFDEMVMTGKPASYFAKAKEQVTDSTALLNLCQEVLLKFPKFVTDYHKNPNAINALVGQVMRASKGRAQPEQVREILQKLLEKKNTEV